MVGLVTSVALQLSFHENLVRFLLVLMRLGRAGQQTTNESIAFMSCFMFYDMIMAGHSGHWNNQASGGHLSLSDGQQT